MNRTALLSALAAVMIFAPPARAQLADSLKRHIDSSLTILKDHSLYARRVDWPKTEAAVYEAATHAVTRAQTFDALKIAFDALGDLHAAYYQYNDHYRIPNEILINRYSDSLKAGWSRGARIGNEMVEGFAYLSLPFMSAGKQEDIDKYAGWISDAVLKLQQQKPVGWIIDLRLNGGGNIRPMLAGIAAFFEDGVVSYYIDRDGKAMDEAAFKDGEFLIDGIRQASLKNKPGHMTTAKIAVLIGPGTASSGEGVAVVLHGRDHTRLFGQSSAGVANATNSFTFNKGESYFLISTAYLGDRNRQVLPEQVTPDVEITDSESFSNIAEDAAVKEALKWLREQ